MSKGATKDYDFGQKNHWRRTELNDVLGRTNGREKTEVILYLAGPDDLDRKLAISKGVPPQNLIAVDRSIENVQKVRANKYPAVNAEIEQVLVNWPDSVSVAAVLLDFCGGLKSRDDIEQISFAMCSPAIRNAVVSVNLLRGRDPASNGFRAKANDDAERYAKSYGVDPLHRGLFFALIQASLMAKAFRSVVDLRSTMGRELFDECLQSLRPRFLSYRSGGLYYDSVVLDPFLPVLGGHLTKHFIQRMCSRFQSVDVKRQVSAMLAVRTGRTLKRA